MTSSIRVFPPGYQVTNASGVVQSGAVLRFFDAGTSNTRTVYSDPAGTVSLGTTVTTNSSGRPAASGGAGAEVSIYVLATSGNYKVSAETSGASSLWSFDDIFRGIATDGFDTTVALPETPVLTKTGDYTIDVGDQGKVINFNKSTAAVATLPSAVTAGDGWRITVRNIHATQTVRIATVSSQTIDGELGYTLPKQYDSVTLVSDAANWHVDATSQLLAHGRLPVFSIVDRDLTTAPTASAGERFIMAGKGGSWSGFSSATGNIAEFVTGTTWIDYTAREGMIAWLQDENRHVTFNGAKWISVSGPVFVTEGSVSAASGIPIMFTPHTQFRGFEINVYGAQPSADNSTLSVIIATDGANTFIGTGVYGFSRLFASEGAVITPGGSAGDSKINVITAVGNAANEGANVKLTILNPFANSAYPRISWVGSHTGPTSRIVTTTGAGTKKTASQCNGIRIAFSTEGIGGTPSSTITASYAVYGLL